MSHIVVAVEDLDAHVAEHIAAFLTAGVSADAGRRQDAGVDNAPGNALGHFSGADDADAVGVWKGHRHGTPLTLVSRKSQPVDRFYNTNSAISNDPRLSPALKK